MNKEQFLKIFYVCITILLITLTLGGVIGCIDSLIDTVHAEELSDQAILNFNQLAFSSYNTSITGVNMLSHNASGVIHITGSAAYNTNFAPFGNDITTTANHIYYLSMIKDDPETRFVYNIFGGNVNTYSDVSMVYTSSGANARLGFFAYSTKVYNTHVKVNLIDLTDMFGAGNEPQTVEAVKEFLPLDYYSYSAGTPILKGQLNYEKGYKDGYNLGYKFNGSDVLFINKINNFNDLNTNRLCSSIQLENETILYYSDNIVANFNIQKGQSYIIQWDLIDNSQHNLILEIQTQSGSELYIDIDESNNKDGKAVVNLPMAYDGNLVISCVDIDSKIYIKNLVIYANTDNQFLYDDGYNRGYKDGVNSVDKDELIEYGINIGINRNQSNMFADGFEFLSTCFNGMAEILTIEFMPNVPIWSLLAIPVLLGVISLIRKLTGD